jgi:hypothetical protein
VTVRFLVFLEQTIICSGSSNFMTENRKFVTVTKKPPLTFILSQLNPFEIFKFSSFKNLLKLYLKLLMKLSNHILSWEYIIKLFFAFLDYCKLDSFLCRFYSRVLLLRNTNDGGNMKDWWYRWGLETGNWVSWSWYYTFVLNDKLSRRSEVWIATDYGRDDRGTGLRLPIGSRTFRLLFIQTVSRT